VQSKARRNQLNLPHGTKTKPDMLKTANSQSPLCQSRRKRAPVVGRICESERVKELWMMRVVNLWKELNWYA